MNEFVIYVECLFFEKNLRKQIYKDIMVFNNKNYSKYKCVPSDIYRFYVYYIPLYYTFCIIYMLLKFKKDAFIYKSINMKYKYMFFFLFSSSLIINFITEDSVFFYYCKSNKCYSQYIRNRIIDNKDNIRKSTYYKYKYIDNIILKKYNNNLF